ncbi:hypothetical protein BJ138DRAFT_1015774 [Hygrophoropsis aurantiaca]|uniref:Uncharacterized protein n=1 Tax=Hygrophoropsis aurantiaca TaxID=72124 RepID=A0ACB8A0N5_9AGAM|nr:hypothetical protein BJ138DRAFT_1015774 [Hygrophoropsis aurantiaca]
MVNLSATSVYVDDTDSALLYSGVWFTAPSSDYQNSSHGTNTAGSSVSFQFTGTQVFVYGSIDPSNESACIRTPISTYTLDATPMTTFFAPIIDTKLNNSLFYESPVIDNGLHTLIITSASQNSLFWLDYIIYTPPGTYV